MEAAVMLYSTSSCTECPRAAAILEALGIPFVKKVIDLDPDAQTDAFMLAVKVGPRIGRGRGQREGRRGGRSPRRPSDALRAMPVRGVK